MRHRTRAIAIGLLGSLALLLVLCSGFWFGVSAQGEEEQKTKTSSRPRGSATTETGKLDSKLEAKLNQILENQQKIFQRFDEVMEELRIVKIRATLK